MNKFCKNCSSQFEITTEDLNFYDKISPIIEGKKYPVPPPTFCPDCRQQRRIAFRNERNLYTRQCDLCKKNIISIYSSDKPFTVYCPSCWWSDKWDPLSFGRNFDFNKPFFFQFYELQKSVPHFALHLKNVENSDYVNMTGYAKNCYLLFASDYDEDCLYGTQVINSKHCIDTTNCLDSQYCYDSTNVDHSYKLLFSNNCKSCSESAFLYDCRNCTNCLFCTNLRNKQYHIFNKPYTKEEYGRKRAEIFAQINTGKLPDLRKSFEELCKKAIHKNLQQTNCESCTGSYLSDSKGLRDCFELAHAEDCAYSCQGYQLKDTMDLTHVTEAELCYEGTSIGFKSYNTHFTTGSYTASNSYYFDNVHTSSDIFGCYGLKHNKFCILNKQYSESDYKKLLAKILEHMGKTGEIGEFFPIKYSPFAYNESKAQEYFPLKKEEAIARNYQWKEEDKRHFKLQEIQIPQNIKDVKDNITKEILSCKNFLENQKLCCKNYKITTAELAFYREENLPIPLKCHDCRHTDRMKQLNPRRLFKRDCAKCGKPIETTFAPNRPEKVYCEKCYLELVI